MKDLKWKRVLLKLSGEALMGDSDFGISPEILKLVANEINDVRKLGVELCLVLGGGNIYRGMSGVSRGMDRTTGDYMGMLATVINSLALQNSLEEKNIETRVMSALPISAVCEPYIRRKAARHIEKGRVVIFAAGTGNPYFTTDTAASLRAAEIEATLMLKSTRVDGVFDKDPEKDTDGYVEDKYFRAIEDHNQITNPGKSVRL